MKKHSEYEIHHYTHITHHTNGPNSYKKILLHILNNIVYIDYFYHFRSLLKNSRLNMKWNNKVLKWTFAIVLIGLLLLGAIYLVQLIFTKNKIQLESNPTIKVSNI